MFIDSASHHVLDRLHDLLITAAATKIPGQIIPNLLLRRLRTLIEQCFGREKKARSAIPALQRAKLHEGFLERMEAVFIAQAFDG